MRFPSTLSRGRKGIRYIIENHKKELVIGIMVLMLFVAIAAAAVYKSMYMQSKIDIIPT